MAHEIKAMKHVFLVPSKVPGHLEMLILINPFRLSVQGKHSIVCDTGSRGLVSVFVLYTSLNFVDKNHLLNTVVQQN